MYIDFVGVDSWLTTFVMETLTVTDRFLLEVRSLCKVLLMLSSILEER